MTRCKFAFFGFPLWIFLNFLFCVSHATLKTTYVEDLCDEWTIDKSLYLRNSFSGILTSVPSKFESGECTIRLKPEHGSSVVLSIYRFHLNPEDQLTITDSDRFQIALIGEGDFPDERKSFTSDGEMTIHYLWNNTVNRGSRLRFQFVFTQVHAGPCRYHEFECRNQKCISKDYVCDRHNHCGDNSDQESCGSKIQVEYPQAKTFRAQPNTWLISIIVCSVILAIVIIVFIVLVVRSNIRRKKMLASKKNLPPTVAATIPQSPTAPPAAQAPPSVFTRFRQSLRGLASRASPTAPTEEESKTDTYEVPTMYPQLPSGPHSPGIENPEFKGDDNA